MTNAYGRLAELSAEGVAIWLDDLSRDRLNSGNLKSLIDEKHVVGVTTNPSIFQAAISKSSLYDDHLRAAAEAGEDAEAAVRRFTTDDVRNAADLFKSVADAGTNGDGRVSIEVDPRLAHDTDATITQAHDLWAEVNRPNIFVKIPATKAGLPAIAQCLAEGISINVTLIFSLQRYLAVMDAFFDGMERARVAGHDLSKMASVASFFVSRVDTEIDKRLDKSGTENGKALRGKAAAGR